MNPNWQEFLGASGARIDNGEVTDFGNFADELVAARDASIVAPLTHFGLLECSGDDAKFFLHNQLTSDINHLAIGAAQHSAWCTAKGRMLASFLLYRNGPDYRALLSADCLPSIEAGLRKYILRSKVRVTDLSGTQEIIGLSGPRAEGALSDAGLPVPPKALNTEDFQNVTVIRLEAARFVVIVASETAEKLWKTLAAGLQPVGTQAWCWLDIQSGLPLVTEATKEAFVPQMADFDKIGGVSFNKGCYPGQEIVARTHYLGKIKRHLYRIHADMAIHAGTVIYSPENPDQLCGTVVNAARAPQGGFDGLAVIQERFVDTGNLRLETPDKTGIEFRSISRVNS